MRYFLCLAASFMLACGSTTVPSPTAPPSTTPSPTAPAPTAPPAAKAPAADTAPTPTTSTTLPGIDVSKFQGPIDWQKVRGAGVVFAYARALEGLTVHDETFAANWQGMKDAGVIRGAYDFYIAADSPEDQLEQFTNLVSLEPGDLAPMVDIEIGSLTSKPPPPDLVENLHRYLELLEAHYGIRPIIYTNPGFWNQYMDDSFGKYPLWVAEYEVEQPKIPQGWTSWIIWQHSQSGAVAGIDGGVDLDVFQGDLQKLEAYRVPSTP